MNSKCAKVISSHIKLLLVEDDEDFSSALVLRLEKRNFDIVVVASAESALGVLRIAVFDVIIADVKLPDIDGVKFLEKVRKIDEDLPVILMTGYASLESAKEAVKLKASDYLLKPFETLDDLLNPIYKAVHGYRLFIENRKLLNELKNKIEELRISELKLNEKNLALEKKNIALKEILEQIELGKKQIKDDIYTNMNKLVFPTIDKLKLNASVLEIQHLDILKSCLEDIISPFGRKITEKSIKLTPREIEICNMIKLGLTSKEISQLLNTCLKTIERHRNNIRKKFNIVDKDINLNTYLQIN